MLLLVAAAVPSAAWPQPAGVAAGIPEPAERDVIVQLFNWRFSDIAAVIPELRVRGYRSIHVSPPQKSNEAVWQWWGRYQPVDFSVISGPLGDQAEFKTMTATAQEHGMRIIVDAVLNHTVDIGEQPDPPFVRVENGVVVAERLPQFEPRHLRPRCNAAPPMEQTCWLNDRLVDLDTEDPDVRQVAKDYLRKLAALGVEGYRFDAAIHIEPLFYADVLTVVPGKLAFGEIIKTRPADFDAWLAVPGMRFYDFPLARTMREAFAFGGDLRRLRDPSAHGGALEGDKAVTFVRNHDIDRGQAGDRGLDPAGLELFGVGWDAGAKRVDRTDVRLAYAYVLGREAGIPYVFVDMKTLPATEQDDRHDDELLTASVRFHNLSLGRPEVWRIEERDTIGWQRGNDRFIVINKSASWYPIRNLATTLLPGPYTEVRNGWILHVQQGGQVSEWYVPPRSAMLFVRTAP